MPERRQARADRGQEPSEEPLPRVAVCRSCPGKLVFIEEGNTEGWISTDSTVELSP